jgi:hypothetical protein
MNFVEWWIEGTEVVNCNCAFGCPCQFDAPPTHGNCRGYGFVQIDRGRFGDVPLDGLRWGVLLSWPGAIHEGNGTFQSIVDERAETRQREALEAISHGRETEPGKLIWQVFSTTISHLLPTLVKPIDLTIDLKARKARVSVPGVIEGSAEPTANPVTAEGHVARITLPNGFEYTEAEIVSGTGRANGRFNLDFDGTHAHLARIHWSTHGVVR